MITVYTLKAFSRSIRAKLQKRDRHGRFAKNPLATFFYPMSDRLRYVRVISATPTHITAMAWETTVEDVENVLTQLGDDIALAPELHGELDHEAIARAALDSGVEMEEQTEGAYAEIKRQINELVNQ